MDEKTADLDRLASSEANWSGYSMFFMRIWILKLISEESTHKVKYGNCNLLSVYLYTCIFM